jgi:hypothetical protein
VCSYKARGDLSEHFSSVLTNTQVIYNGTQHGGQVLYFFYKIHVDRKPLRSFARAVGSSYKARATANQIARNMTVIL